jgi:hypothetical protein
MGVKDYFINSLYIVTALFARAVFCSPFISVNAFAIGEKFGELENP